MTVAVTTAALGRRQLMQAAGAIGVAAAAAGSLASRPATAQGAIVSGEHWAEKGPVNLYLYRKRVPSDLGTAKPVLFLVHGSTFSSRGRYDLQVPPEDAPYIMTLRCPVTCSTTGRPAFRSSTPTMIPAWLSVREERP